jgi:soluble lytic murein transglycosylase-like protein
VAKELGLKSYNVFDTETNLLLGASYLKKMLDKYDGDLELALTAYHTGPGNVDRYLASSKTRSLDAIIDKLGPVGKRYAKSILGKTGDA